MTSGVLFGGPSPEHDISILTGLQALRELSRADRATQGIYWTKTGSFFYALAGIQLSMMLLVAPAATGRVVSVSPDADSQEPGAVVVLEVPARQAGAVADAQGASVVELDGAGDTQ